MTTYPVIEQPTGSRLSRWLRARRLRIALLIGAVETVWIIFTDATWRWALVIAAAVFLFHFFIGRKIRFESVRQLSWTAAASQFMPVLVPLVAVIVGTLIAVAIIVLALVVLGLLLLDRR